MTHKHEQAELITQFYVAQENSDLTEGRGGMRDIAAFATHRDAYDRAKGRAVQGCGDGDVVKRTYYRCATCPELVKVDERIYVGDGYSRKNLLGKGSYAAFLKDGWRKDYSPLGSDPEFDEFMRLRKKFQGVEDW